MTTEAVRRFEPFEWAGECGDREWLSCPAKTVLLSGKGGSYGYDSEFDIVGQLLRVPNDY